MSCNPRCLLSKWIFKLLTEDSVWQSLLRNKYLGHKQLTSVEAKPTDSHFCKSLMKVKKVFSQFASFKVENGEPVRLWEHKWIGDMPLSAMYPRLFNIVRHKDATVDAVFRV